jgi:predicted transcriptional regulator/transcriptional regulator with XRE-family HTH domain
MDLTQARMAEDLGISSSYQNLIERNQRPLTAQILLRLADAFDIDFRQINLEEESGSLSAIKEVFADPFFSDYDLTDNDLQELVTTLPVAASAVAALYRAYRDCQTSASILADNIAGTGDTGDLGSSRLPVEEVRDFFHDRLNYFPSLDQVAETLHETLGLHHDDPYVALRTYLADAHSVTVQVMPDDLMQKALRRYDYHRRRILLSELLDQAGRNFQLAVQIALLEQHDLINQTISEAPISGEESRRICRIGLARYFAGALLMPYDRFRTTAEALQYDCEALCRRFDTSFEQVCHRLTTLQRPGARGIPFFLVRLDSAGNITKRFSPDVFPFARSGGACPRWNVHDTFRAPGQIFTQIIALPDGMRYFSFARTVSRPSSEPGRPELLRSIGLGCPISYAEGLVYSNGCDLADDSAVTEIGINCFLCERADCDERAFPPLARRISVDENVRGLSAYSFESE